MKKIISTKTLPTVAFITTVQTESSIVIDANSFRAEQQDSITGESVNLIRSDHAYRPCARMKIFFHNMTREQLADICAIFPSHNIELTKIMIADCENAIILEMTAKPNVPFCLEHPAFGTSNEVKLSFEGKKEYYIEATSNQIFNLVVCSNVEGADVYLDGMYMGVTDASKSFTISEVMFGAHKLKLIYGNVSTEQDLLLPL